MPLTFPAHQAAVVPLKLWRPRWFDGIALVVGSGSPDLFNALVSIETFDSHHWDGVQVAVAFTIVYSILLRRFAIDGLFGAMPDLGPLKARSYRVLAQGRPRLLVTAFSAFVGVMSHVVIDSFTHAHRIGSNLLGISDPLVDLPLVGPVSGAKILQYFGHSFGSLVGVILFVLVVSRRHLGEWYGTDSIVAARRAPVRRGARTRLIIGSAGALIGGFVWGVADGVIPVFHMGLTFVVALLVIGITNRERRAATLDACPVTFIHLDTTSSTSSVEHSLRISHRSVT